MSFQPDQFLERAAILEYGHGMTRFEAETLAAQFQGVARWEALPLAKEYEDEIRRGPAGATGHPAHALDGQRDANDLSRVQPQPEEETRPLSVGEPEAGRDRGELLALRESNGGAL